MMHMLVDSMQEGPNNLQLAANSLLFDDLEEAENFINACGYPVNFSSKNRVTNKKSKSDIFSEWSQHSPLRFLDQLRGSKSRCQIMQTPVVFRPSTMQSPPLIPIS